MQIISYLLVHGISVFIAAYLLPGVVITSIWTALLVAIVLGVANTFIKPLLVLLTLPLTLITFGLFTFVINGLLVLLASWIVSGFEVENFLWALLFSLVITLISSFFNNLVKNTEH